MPADRHDFCHREPDVALDQHDALFSVPERDLVIDLVGPNGLPDIVSLAVMFPLPVFCGSYLFRVICLLIFCPLRIKIGLAQVVQERHGNQALVGVFSSIAGTYNPSCFLLKKELLYDTIKS